MEAKSAHFWRHLARVFLVPVFAWLLSAQSILLPLAKAQAASLAGSDKALTILCSPTIPTSGESGDDTGSRQVHDFGCCTLAGRFSLDMPFAVLAAPPSLAVADRAEHFVFYVLPQGRAPPDITATPSAARAPPTLS